MLDLDVEEQRRILAGSQSHDFTVDGFSLLERLHPASLDLVASLAEDIVALNAFGLPIDKHHISRLLRTHTQ